MTDHMTSSARLIAYMLDTGWHDLHEIYAATGVHSATATRLLRALRNPNHNEYKLGLTYDIKTVDGSNANNVAHLYRMRRRVEVEQLEAAE